MKFFFYEFCSIIFYFFYRLYLLVNKIFILSYNNGKLSEYIKKESLHNTVSNFENAKTNYFDSYTILNLISPSKYKQGIFILLITFEIFALNLAFRYNIFFSNFIPIRIFNKNIDVVSLFSPYFDIVRYSYLVIYMICIFDVLYNIFNSKYINNLYLSTKKSKLNNYDLEQEIKNENILLGECNENLVYLSKEGLYQNVLITGSIGSGKTSAAITNVLDGLIKNNMSGLVIDVKGNYIDTVEKVAKKYNKSDDIVYFTLDSDIRYNPLNNNFSEVELSSMLKNVLSLLSPNNNSDSFWLDKVENYIRDFLVLIRSYNSFASFYEIHKLVTDSQYLLSKIKLVKENVLKNKYSDEELFKINSCINNIKKEFISLDTRTLSIIKAEITRITSVFVSDYNIYNKFCFESNNIDFFNKIVVLSIGIGENKALSKIISTYLKLDFQKQVLSRNLNSSNSLNSIFFICDEFQEVCNEEDATFFSISREYKCINVISMQSYTSLINALRNENSAKVIIQNLVNKIWFRNDDIFTINEIIKQVGKEIKQYEVKNISENGQNTRYSAIDNSFVDYKTGISKGYTYNQVLDYKLNEKYFTTYLKTFEAVCILSNGNNVEYVDKVFIKRWEC